MHCIVSTLILNKLHMDVHQWVERMLLTENNSAYRVLESHVVL